MQTPDQTALGDALQAHLKVLCLRCLNALWGGSKRHETGYQDNEHNQMSFFPCGTSNVSFDPDRSCFRQPVGTGVAPEQESQKDSSPCAWFGGTESLYIALRYIRQEQTS